MVFSVIESDITKSGQALSIFGKELQNVYHDFNSAIHSIKTKTGDISQFSIGRILGNKLSQQDIDSIRRYNDEIRKYNEMTDDAITPQTAFYKCLGNSSSAAQKLARDANGAAISEETLKTASQTSTVALKAQSIAMNLLGNIAITAIIIGISKIVKGFVDLVNHVEITKKKVEDLKSTFKSALDTANSNAKRVKELADRYDELSDGVNNLGENVSLTNEEYEEYNTLVNEIADMFPTLVQGYTDEGNAILNLKGNVDALRNAYKEAQQEAYNLLIANGQDSDGNDIIQQWNDLYDTGFWASAFDLGVDDVGKGISVSDALEQLKAIQNLTAEEYREIKRIVDSGGSEELSQLSDIELEIGNSSYLKGALGLTWDISDEDFAEAKKQASALVQTYNAQIESALSDVKTLANAYLMTNEDYDKLDEQSKNAASIIVNSLDADIASGFKDKTDVDKYVQNIIDTINNNSEVNDAMNKLFTMDTSSMSVREIKSNIDKYISIIAKAIGEDEEKLKIRFGFDDIGDELDRAYEKFGLKTDGSSRQSTIDKRNFLAGLNIEDLEAALNIPDLFAEGLDGATAKIEAWKADPKNKIAPEVDTSDLNTIIETTSNKVKLITTAMEEMNDTGSISSSTYAEIVEMGGNFADCLEIQNGKLKLNVQKLKELERQEILNAIAAKNLAISELNVSAAMAGQARDAEKVEEIRKQITALEKERDVLWQINDEIANAKPNESGSGSGSSSSSDPWKEQFDKEYSEKQHLLAMEQLSEEDYLDWLDDAYKKYFSDLTKYQDEYYKYEEEVYKGRKQLAEDFYDEQQKLFEDRVSNLEDYLEKFKDGKVTTFVEQSDIDALDELNKQMKELYEVGNVDLTKRPKVSAETMRKAGYDVADGSTATVYSTMEFLWQGDEENGKYVTVHYTPILPDGTVLDEKTLHDYIYGTLAGSQNILNADAENLGIVLKVDTDFNISEEDMKSLETGNYTDNIQNIIKACDDWSVSLHDIQAEWMVLDEKVKNIQPLTIEEKYDYISSVYQEIINEINARIGEILDVGIEGHEEEVAKLEKQIEEYQEKLSNVFKSAVEEEQDYIEKQKKAYSDLYDERIDKIKEQQKAVEEAAQAEIDAVQEKIDVLKEANEKAEEANEIEKARQDLANASQHTRQVYGADGSISLQVDQDKVKEAQEKLDKLLQEQQINILEEQKQALEDAKDKASESYDRIIENLEIEKENGEKRFNKLIEKLDEYLNPNNGESNSDVWKAIAKLEGGKYENGIYTDKDGNVIDIDKLLETAKNEDKQTDTDNKTKDNSKDDTVISGTLTRQDIGDEEPDIKGKTESAIDTFFSNLEKKLNIPSGSINLENAMQVFRNSPMMNFNPYGAMNDRTGLANKEYVNNVNNQQSNVTSTFTGDIVINNPVGNSDDLAKELIMNIPIAFQKQMYSNLK